MVITVSPSLNHSATALMEHSMQHSAIINPTGINNGQKLRIELARAISQVQIAKLHSTTTSQNLADALQATIDACTAFLADYVTPPPVTP